MPMLVTAPIIAYFSIECFNDLLFSINVSFCYELYAYC